MTMDMDTDLIEPAGVAERERVLKLLCAKESELRAMGVMRLRLFGSMARGEAGPESDVDLIADVDRRNSFSLLDLIGIKRYLEDVLARDVDIGTTVEKMRPWMRKRFEADVVEVF